jgi:DNA-binding transcriptional MerR regulator
MAKSIEAFRTISEVSDDLGIPKHVLRFWEAKFTQLKPMKRGGGRRYYRPEDLELLTGIHHLLHSAGYTIRGVQKILREQGVEAVKAHAQDDAQGGDVQSSGDASSKSRLSPRAATLDKLIAEVKACIALSATLKPSTQAAQKAPAPRRTA